MTEWLCGCGFRCTGPNPHCPKCGNACEKVRWSPPEACLHEGFVTIEAARLRLEGEGLLFRLPTGDTWVPAPTTLWCRDCRSWLVRKVRG